MAQKPSTNSHSTKQFWLRRDAFITFCRCTVFDLLWYLSVGSGATDCCCFWWSFLFWHQHDSRSSDEHVGASVLRECGLRIVFQVKEWTAVFYRSSWGVSWCAMCDRGSSNHATTSHITWTTSFSLLVLLSLHTVTLSPLWHSCVVELWVVWCVTVIYLRSQASIASSYTVTDRKATYQVTRLRYTSKPGK